MSKKKTKKKKKSRYSKFVVLFVITLNTLFTAAVLYVFLKTSTEPAVLITAWFGFTTAELWALAGIKKADMKKENRYDC